jgi:hypothetical protein
MGGVSDEPELPESTEANSYPEIEAEVSKHFDGDWRKFLLAVENPAEVLHFVLKEHFGKDQGKFAAWAERKGLPRDWLPRFYMTLTDDGELGPEIIQAEAPADPLPSSSTEDLN